MNEGITDALKCEAFDRGHHSAHHEPILQNVSRADEAERESAPFDRFDVEHAIDWYLSEYDQSWFRSPIGRLVIDETRIDKKSSPRKDLYRRGEPIVPKLANGAPMRRVIAPSLILQVIKSRSSRAASGTYGLTKGRMRLLTIASILWSLDREWRNALLRGAALRFARDHAANRVVVLTDQLSSDSWRRAHRKEAESARAELAHHRRTLDRVSANHTGEISRLSRETAYKEGLKWFRAEILCKELFTGDDVQSVVFPPRLT